jgi:hypothetical protein
MTEIWWRTRKSPGRSGLRPGLVVHPRDLNPEPTEGYSLNSVFTECLRNFADSLVFTGNRAVHWVQLYSVYLGRLKLILMGK